MSISAQHAVLFPSSEKGLLYQSNTENLFDKITDSGEPKAIPILRSRIKAYKDFTQVAGYAQTKIDDVINTWIKEFPKAGNLFTEILFKNRGLVSSYIKRRVFSDRRLERLDPAILEEVAEQALKRAIAYYDRENNNNANFSTYATFLISRDLTAFINRPGTKSSLKEILGIDPKIFSYASDAKESLFKPRQIEALKEYLRSSDFENRERYILRSRFEFLSLESFNKIKSYDELASELKISPNQVIQIEKNALNKLKVFLDNECISDDATKTNSHSLNSIPDGSRNAFTDHWSRLRPMDKETLILLPTSDIHTIAELRGVKPRTVSSYLSRLRAQGLVIEPQNNRRLHPNSKFETKEDFSKAPEDYKHIEEQWSKLLPREQAIITLFLKGQTQEEISDSLNLSIWAVQNHKCKALKTIGKYLIKKPSIVSEAKWGKLKLLERKVLALRLEYPELSDLDLSKRLNLSEQAVRSTRARIKSKVNIDTKKTAVAERRNYNHPPGKVFSKEEWLTIPLNDRPIAWLSYRSPTWGAQTIASRLGLLKPGKELAIIKEVKEARRRIKSITGKNFNSFQIST